MVEGTVHGVSKLLNLELEVSHLLGGWHPALGLSYLLVVQVSDFLDDLLVLLVEFGFQLGQFFLNSLIPGFRRVTLLT